MGARLKEKEVEGNMVGEGLVLGGVLVVDKAGSIQYMYKEETGSEVPVEEIKTALGALVD